MQATFNQVQLESIAHAPDATVANHLKPVTVTEQLSPEPNQLLIRTILSPIHPCDLLCAAGLVPRRTGERDGKDNHMFLPGLESVGEVTEVGSALEGKFKKGERVFTCCWAPWGTWQEANGVWSEYIVVNQDNVIPVPDGISDTTAAMFLVIPVTAYVMMIEELGLKQGDWLVQNASGSAVGRWVIALAEELGINTINLVRREEQVEELKRETGAKHVLWAPGDGSRNAELKATISELTGDAPVSGALDAVGDGQFASVMLQSLSRYGTVLVYGVLSGTSMSIEFNSTCQIALEALNIKGFSLQNWWLPDTSDEDKRRVYDAVWKHIANNEALNPAVHQVYAFENIDQAIRSSLEQKTGKILLRPRKET